MRCNRERETSWLKKQSVTQTERKEALASFLRDSGLEAESNTARLLGYVVTEVVEGRAQGIKALTIAQDVFGRGASFDPSKDSLVRVEIKRLRDILDHHYATTGAEAWVCIRIPKGTYVPVFERRAVASALAGDEATGGVAHGRRRAAQGVGLALLVSGLVAVVWLVLAEPPDPGDGEPKVRVASVSGAESDAEKVALETLSRFRNFAVLKPGQTGTYALTLDGSSTVVKAQFVHEASGEVVVSANFEAQEIGALSDSDELSRFGSGWERPLPETVSWRPITSGGVRQLVTWPVPCLRKPISATRRTRPILRPGIAS